MLKSSFRLQTITFILVLFLSTMLTASARAAEPETIVDLGAGLNYAVFAGTEIINTGTATKITGDIGTSPVTLITGLTTDQLTVETTPANDDNANLVQNDLITAYNNIKDRDNAKAITTNLGGQTLSPGVYSLNLPATVTGTLKLDAQGDINAVFIFQVNSTLITEKNSRIELINGAQFSRVFWQVANNVTLGEKTIFKGNILANASIFSETDVSVQGRLLAITGGVTLTNTQVAMTEIVPLTDNDNSELPKPGDIPKIVEETPKIVEPDVDIPQADNSPDSASTVPAIDVPIVPANTSPVPVATTAGDSITLDGSGDTYKVTIDWGSMTFNYDLGTWNPSAHSWVGGGWNAAGFNGSNNQINIMNESTQPVTAAFTYICDETNGGSTTGTFEDNNGNQTGIMELPLCPVGGPAPTANTYLKLQGQPAQIGSTPTKIGSITILLNSVLP
ncbi:DUF3494 domain-containing protein [Acetobacterium paludosum]|uniref:DUF3494 domain-containing protein n=1 Tax=Acetobacterium paludosum TaxID=52693 RepID=A0A923KP65_9FIRM|nr:ice-binding family protein [Acetobacterium paludosum]MBC3887824.1 DUF3494 domain-containing protein [Acetobacterium paludosum]